MTKNVFSVPIFLIVLRESIEAGIIVSILLTFVHQLVTVTDEASEDAEVSKKSEDRAASEGVETLEDRPLTNAQLLRKLKIQVWAGTLSGFFIALAIGAAFIGVFYTNKLRDLWAQSEEIWEGVFSLIAAFIILVMGIAFLRLEQSKAKWRVKLAYAFQRKTEHNQHRSTKGKYALFLLPFITVLREGLEAVVFVGGVSLGEPATSIPLAVVIGLLCGAIISYLIYRGGSALAIHWFLVVSTCVLFLVGAGLFSRGCGYFQTYVFNRGVGSDVSEVGDGPGSFDVDGNVWHLLYGNPEGGKNQGGGWSIFNAILGWTNTATLGTILCYSFYWIAVIGILVYLKWSEGRSTILGFKSRAYREREARGRVAAGSKSHRDSDPEAATPDGASTEGGSLIYEKRPVEIN
ncbi:hypothetical protein BOTBODRAFT_160045 [Botryobasidium botryosum FD-172 SS1]|uniref:Iron permease FTR1 n=1 Tax=Botryobasidium botryosum (strain FD-172 SS1) TaxID=930990 RepID=A0A067MGE4_BOTB1|nr:hypothetical protein BOTBODRAFT_160045 [Botryobasidium botryosum FD-172 SS1]